MPAYACAIAGLASGSLTVSLSPPLPALFPADLPCTAGSSGQISQPDDAMLRLYPLEFLLKQADNIMDSTEYHCGRTPYDTRFVFHLSELALESTRIK